MDIRILGRYQNQTVQSYRLKNTRGMEVEVLNLGGIIKSINYRGKNRVLGFENYVDYINKENEFGINLFRALDGKDTEKKGLYNKRIWSLHETRFNGLYESFTLRYSAKDGEDGLRGNRKYFVKYSLTHNNELIIENQIKTDRESQGIITNQSYFNFSDHLDEKLLDHTMEISAENYLSFDKDKKFLAKKSLCKASYNFKAEGDFLELGGDHPLLLDKQDRNISLKYKDIEMKISSDQPALVFYKANDRKACSGLCFNTYSYEELEDLYSLDRLLPEEEYYNKTVYSFK